MVLLFKTITNITNSSSYWLNIASYLHQINSKNINNFFALIVSTKECSDYIKIKYGSEFFNEIENLAENELYSFEKINAENNSEYDGLDNPDE